MSTSGGITLKLHSFLGGGGVVVVVVVVVVELVSSPPPADVSLAARFFLRGANWGQVYTYTGASRISKTRNGVNSVSEKIQQTQMKQKMETMGYFVCFIEELENLTVSVKPFQIKFYSQLRPSGPVARSSSMG